MPAASQRAATNRLVSRSLPEHHQSPQALHPLTTTSHSHPAPSSRLHPPDKSSSAGSFLHASPSQVHDPSRMAPPLSVQLRRYWKKLNETDSTGKRSRFAQAFAAFKMGLYFKLFITSILLVRIASHSSQRAFPSSARLPDDHFRLLSSSPHLTHRGTGATSRVRIVVITQTGYSDRLHSLLKSLGEADYDHDAAALDVWMFSSSACNYLPLPLYPLAVALFGPPRFDHSIPRVVHHLQWPHGPKTLVATRTEPNVAHAWQSNRATRNETLIFFDAANVQSVSPHFYTWLKAARTSLDRSHLTGASVLSLDAIPLADGVPSGDNAVLVDAFFPATGAFSPTPDVWVTFQKWFALRTRSWFARPKLPGVLFHVGGYSLLEAMRMYPTHAWFAQFLSEYRERVVHPVLPDRRTLLLRAHGTTAGAIPGSGRRPNFIPRSLLHLDRRAEQDANLLFTPSTASTTYVGTVVNTAMHIPARPVVVNPNLSVTSIAEDDASMDHSRDHDLEHDHELTLFGSSDAIAKYRSTRAVVGGFARARGTASVSMMLVTTETMPLAHSWLCNVAALGITPPALVLVAADDSVAKMLSAFVSRHARVRHDALVVSMRGALRPLASEADRRAIATAVAPHDRERARNVLAVLKRDPDWRLMLLRCLLLRDLLGDGLAVLQLDPAQVWFDDPMPYFDHLFTPPWSASSSSSSTASSSSTSGTTDAVIRPDDSAAGLVDDARDPDAVMAAGSDDELSPGLMMVRPTVGTRHLFARVVDRLFFLSASASFASAATAGAANEGVVVGPGKVRGSSSRRASVVNEQTIVTALVCGRDWSYARRFPRIKAALLDRALFVDARWMDDLLGDGAQQAHRGGARQQQQESEQQQQQQPVTVRNNPAGASVADKVARAKQFGLWFVRVNNTDSARSCDDHAVLAAAKMERPGSGTANSNNYYYHNNNNNINSSNNNINGDRPTGQRRGVGAAGRRRTAFKHSRQSR